jgi:hypothetical protein
MPMIPGEDRLNRHFRKRSFLTKIMSPPVYWKYFRHNVHHYVSLAMCTFTDKQKMTLQNFRIANFL